jgi:lipopolysaccharide biosynthesis glycosyltransferase
MKNYYDIKKDKTEEEILEDAYIIHFSGKGKPWKYYDVYYADNYKTLWIQSPFKYKKLNRENYYNDRVRKMIGDIYMTKDYKLGHLIMKFPRFIKKFIQKGTVN